MIISRVAHACFGHFCTLKKMPLLRFPNRQDPLRLRGCLAKMEEITRHIADQLFAVCGKEVASVLVINKNCTKTDWGITEFLLPFQAIEMSHINDIDGGEGCTSRWNSHLCIILNWRIFVGVVIKENFLCGLPNQFNCTETGKAGNLWIHTHTGEILFEIRPRFRFRGFPNRDTIENRELCYRSIWERWTMELDYIIWSRFQYYFLNQELKLPKLAVDRQGPTESAFAWTECLGCWTASFALDTPAHSLRSNLCFIFLPLL